MDKNQNVETVYSKLNTFALLATFITFGVLLFIYPNFFGSEVTTRYVRLGFIGFAILGFFSEIYQSKGIQRIQGANELITGIVMTVIGFLLYVTIRNFFVNALGLLILLSGVFAIYKNILIILYSIFTQRAMNKNNKKIIITDIILLLTRIASLLLVVVQIFILLK